jgi:hypothetical protein
MRDEAAFDPKLPVGKYGYMLTITQIPGARLAEAQNGDHTANFG